MFVPNQRVRIRLCVFPSILVFAFVLLTGVNVFSAEAPDADLYFKRTGIRDHSIETNVAPSKGDAATANAVPLSNGVDPYNLGKGDWIWTLSSCRTALGVSTDNAVLDYEKSRGMQWVTVKCGDGGTTWSQFTSNLVNHAHSIGLKIFGWAYVYGRNVQGEINVATNCLYLGADGFIIDAEIEYETNAFNEISAIRMCQGIRAAYPNRFLAHAPFPYLDSHSGYPYFEFGLYCDAVMPQAYWQAIGISPATMISNMDTKWKTWQNGLTGFRTNAIRPIIPIGQGYNNSSADPTPGTEITAFIDGLNADASPASKNGYRGVSWWSCQHHTADHWTAIGNGTNPPMVNLPPAIANAPVNRSVQVGSNATFSVTAFGAMPIYYQWKVNGTNLANATNASYTISSAQLSNAGDYTCLITNATGSITTTAAKLFVNAALPTLQLAFSDSFETNSSSLWNIFQGSGNGVSDYTATFGHDYSAETYTTVGLSSLTTYTTNTVGVAPNTTNGTRLGLKLTVNKNDGTASGSGVSLYPKNMNFGSNYVLRCDMWLTYNGGPNGGSGSTEYANFGLNHTGTRVNWYTTSTTSDGIWFSVDGEGGSGTSDYRAFQGTGATPTELAFASSGFAANGAQSQSFLDTFYGGLFPSPTYETPGVPGKKWVQCELSVINGLITWKMNNVVVAQRTNTSSYTSGNIMIGYMDIFSGIASPPQDNFLIIDNVRVYTVATPPSITSQPTSRTENIGADTTFSVTATGSSPLSYQWKFNSGVLSGATNSFLTLTNLEGTQAGNYSVTITNVAGSTNSATANLSLVTMQVSSSSLLATNGVFQFAVSGTPGAGYFVESSTNLVLWEPVGTFTNVNGTLQIVDQAATNHEKFYRISAPR